MSDNEQNSPESILFAKIAGALDKKGELKTGKADVTIADLWRQVCASLEISDWELASHIADLSQLKAGSEIKNTPEALVTKVPYNIANSYHFLPVAMDDNTVVIAICNPFDESMNELIQFIFGINTRCEIVPPSILDVAIASAYEKLSGEGGKGEVHLDEVKVDDLISRQIPRLARHLLKKALENGASDLHVQDFIGGSVVRIRVDGILQRLVILPTPVAKGLIRYFKALGSMDPTSTLRPQDGRVAVKLDGQDYDLRMSVIPTQGGIEKLVVRFLNRSAVYKLSSHSFSLEEIHTLHRMASVPSGVVLICGPTGSGKTTTLYSILSELNTEEVSISTVENPVEYSMPGLAQTEINDKAGVTFASALRSILRQDPDIILIGEIRDEETAQIAMQSALTGHLVFSTLHTNDALSAIPRLLELDVPPAILTEALVGLVSQRLLRKLCEHCKEDVDGQLSPLEHAFNQVTNVLPGARPGGCDKCNYSGYSGRVVISEMFEIDAALRKMILAGEVDIQKLHKSIDGGNQNLSVSASRLIVSGSSTVNEAVRVIGRHFWIELAEEYQSELPGLSVINSGGSMVESNLHPSILLAGSPDSYSKELQDWLEAAWFNLHFATSAEEANNILRENDQIAFFVLSLDADKNDTEVLAEVAAYRKAVAWSRLPALIRVPDGREGLEEKLVADGATSRFHSMSAPVEELVEIINMAISAHAGFAWGLDKQD